MLGNITGMSTSSATTTYTYAETGYANPHAVTGIGNGVATTTHSYDNNGNVTAIGSLDYTWDWRNRLASAERSSGGVTSYGYDHAGQRVFKATGAATRIARRRRPLLGFPLSSNNTSIKAGIGETKSSSPLAGGSSEKK